jgi:hypothetical protein
MSMAIANIESLESPARQVLERGKRTLERIVQRVGKRNLAPLQASANEATFLIEAARLAVESLGMSGDKTEQRLHKARLRGLSKLAELRKAAEPSLETAAVCELLGVSRETVRKKVERKQILALPKGESDRVFPAFQFQDGTVAPGVREVLEQLNTDSPFVALSFFLSRSPVFGNKSAIDALKAGLADEVLAEARGFLNHGS